MNFMLLVAFLVPIIVVVIMALKPSWFKGWKVNVQGALVGLIAGVQGIDLSFITDNIAIALTGGASLAIMLASKLTKRKE